MLASCLARHLRACFLDLPSAKVGWGFHPNKNNEFKKVTNCHPELDSGSSHRKECLVIWTQKSNVGLKSQSTLIPVSSRRRSM